MNFSMNIHPVDGTIVIVYLLAVLAFGLWIGRGQRTSADYFLGGRSLPWGALLLSIVATETSTVTFLSLPGIAAAQNGNLTFLQITIGYIVGRLLIIHFLLPLYFRGEIFTAYEVLESRFGKLSRRAASVLFLGTRNVSDALRLFLTALVLQIVLGLDLTTSVIALGTITMGGAKSVIWNDVIQFVIYMLGALAAFTIIVQSTPGGLTQLIQFAEGHDKLRMFDFDFSLTKPTMTFWAGLVGGAFLTAATHGTDQLMVQRYLSARNQHDAAKGLAFSGLIVFAQFAVFLVIGVALAGFFSMSAAPNPLSNGNGDQLFAFFIVNHMPIGLTGLTLAAVFAAAMSTLSSSLNSSATALINDVYLPQRVGWQPRCLASCR
jgi:SSS family transporter